MKIKENPEGFHIHHSLYIIYVSHKKSTLTGALIDLSDLSDIGTQDTGTPVIAPLPDKAPIKNSQQGESLGSHC